MNSFYSVLSVLHAVLGRPLDGVSLDGLGHAAQGLAAAAVSGLVSSAWQGAVLAVCVLLCLRMFPGLSAAARSAIWLNVFAALVLLHGWPLLMGHSAAAGGPSRMAAFELSERWSFAIAAVWAVLTLVRAVQLTVSAMRLRGLSQRAVPIEAEPEIVPLLTVKLGGRLSRRAELCVSDDVARPSVIGFLHPRILMPPMLMARLTADELKQVVLHEMEHLKRADDWTNLAQKLALAMFPLNAPMLWVEHRLCAERELACDDGVLKSSCGRKAYAICLTRLAEYTMLRRGLSLALGAWERQSELVRRVHRILRRPAEQMSARQTVVLSGGLMAGVLVCAAGLAHSPLLVGFKEPAEHMQIAQSQMRQADIAALPVSTYRADGFRAVELTAQMGADGASVLHTMARETAPVARPHATRRATPQSVQQLASQQILEAYEQQALAEQVMMRQAVAQQAMARGAEPDQPATQQRMVVTTSWSADGVSQRVVYTVARTPMNASAETEGDARPEVRQQVQGNAQQQTGDAAKTAPQRAPAQAVPATARYAAVPFADGWILVRI